MKGSSNVRARRVHKGARFGRQGLDLLLCADNLRVSVCDYATEKRLSDWKRPSK